MQEVVPLHELQRCVYGTMELVLPVLKDFLFKQKEKSLVKDVFDQTTMWYGECETAANCAFVLLPEAKIAKAALTALKYYNAVLDVGKTALKYPGFIEKGFEVAENCGGVYVG